MPFQFDGFAVQSVGDILTEDRFGWVPISLHLTDSETNAHPSIEIQIPIPYDRNSSLSDIRQSAFNKARAVLAEAIALFDANGLDGLQ